MKMFKLDCYRLPAIVPLSGGGPKTQPLLIAENLIEAMGKYGLGEDIYRDGCPCGGAHWKLPDGTEVVIYSVKESNRIMVVFPEGNRVDDIGNMFEEMGYVRTSSERVPVHAR